MRKLLIVCMYVLFVGLLPGQAQQFDGQIKAEFVLEGTDENYTFITNSMNSKVTMRPNGLGAGFWFKPVTIKDSKNAKPEMIHEVLDTKHNQIFEFIGEGLASERPSLNNPFKKVLNGRLQWGAKTFMTAMPITITTDGKEFTYRAELYLDIKNDMGIEIPEAYKSKLNGKLRIYITDHSN